MATTEQLGYNMSSLPNSEKSEQGNLMGLDSTMQEMIEQGPSIFDMIKSG